MCYLLVETIHLQARMLIDKVVRKKPHAKPGHVSFESQLLPIVRHELLDVVPIASGLYSQAIQSKSCRAYAFAA